MLNVVLSFKKLSTQSLFLAIINTDRNCRPFDEYSPGLCQTNCYSNLDCASEDMCCSTGCGTGCVPRKLPPKPGKYYFIIPLPFRII